MTRLVIDAATLAKLNNLNEPYELCDEKGRTLGYFNPAVAPTPAEGPPLSSPFSDEEIQRRRQQRNGRPLSEILERLGNA